RGDTGPRLEARSRPRYPQCPASAQAADQLPLQRTARFAVPRLIDGLVADPHSHIIGEVQREPSSDLFWTPCLHPGPITPVRLVASLPRGGGGTDDDLAISAANDAGQFVLDVLTQPVVANELGGLGAAGAPLGVPLRSGGLIVESIGAGRGIAAQLP